MQQEIKQDKPVEIEFPKEVLAEARAEDIAVQDGTYEAPEDGDKSEKDDKSKSVETKDDESGKTTEDDDGDKDDKSKKDEKSEGILFEKYEQDGKPLYVADKDGKQHELKQVIEDHLNNLNWQKTNTEKNQALSQKETELTDRIAKYDVESIVEALNAEEGALLTQLDAWFTPEGQDPDPAKNPLRNITGAMAVQSDEDKAEADIQNQAYLEVVQEEVDLEYTELEKIDPKYKETSERDTLMQLALMPKTLLEAHQLRDADGLATKVKKLTTELTARNKAYDKLVAQKGPAEDGLGGGEDGKGTRESSAAPGEVKSFEDQAKQGLKAFLEM